MVRLDQGAIDLDTLYLPSLDLNSWRPKVNPAPRREAIWMQLGDDLRIHNDDRTMEETIWWLVCWGLWQHSIYPRGCRYQILASVVHRLKLWILPLPIITDVLMKILIIVKRTLLLPWYLSGAGCGGGMLNSGHPWPLLGILPLRSLTLNDDSIRISVLSLFIHSIRVFLHIYYCKIENHVNKVF